MILAEIIYVNKSSEGQRSNAGWEACSKDLATFVQEESWELNKPIPETRMC